MATLGLKEVGKFLWGGREKRADLGNGVSRKMLLSITDLKPILSIKTRTLRSLALYFLNFFTYKKCLPKLFLETIIHPLANLKTLSTCCYVLFTTYLYCAFEGKQDYISEPQ